MSRHQGLTDLKASYIDILLGALGGISLLVVLYFAMQSANPSRASKIRPESFAVRLDACPDGWRIGDEVGLFVESSDGDACYMELGKTVDSGELHVKWPTYPAGAGQDFYMTIASDKEKDLSLGIWVRQLVVPSKGDAGRALQIAREWLHRKHDLKLSAHWPGKSQAMQALQISSQKHYFGVSRIAQ